MNFSLIIEFLLILKKQKLVIQQSMFIFILLFVGVVQAQNFPSKPMKVAVNYPPGGSGAMSMGETKKFLEVEKVKYTKLIKENNIKAD